MIFFFYGSRNRNTQGGGSEERKAKGEVHADFLPAQTVESCSRVMDGPDHTAV